MKKLNNNHIDIISTSKREYFDNAFKATKIIAKYNADKKTFGATFLAFHFCNRLK